MKTAIELRQEQASILSQMRDIEGNADKEKRQLTDDEIVKWDKWDSDFEGLTDQISRAEKIEARQAQEDADKGKDAQEDAQRGLDKDDSKETPEEKRSAVFGKYMRDGLGSLTNEERTYLSYQNVEGRAQTTQTGSSGGYTIPTLMANKIWEALLDFGGARALGTVISTSGGEQIDYPTSNDTAQSGALLSENTQVSEQDKTFGTEPLNAYTFTSKMIRVPNQLLQDSKFDIAGHIVEALKTRIGRANNTYFTTGTGSSQPEGFITGASAGITAAGAAAVTWDELMDLEHSVGSAYRANAKYTFADSTLKALKKLKDGNSNYLWQMGDVKAGAPATINGYNYVINDDVAAMATTAKSIAFGDFSKFLIRDVGAPVVMRLSERYADYNQTAFVVFTRSDSAMIDAGTNPVKYITQA